MYIIMAVLLYIFCVNLSKVNILSKADYIIMYKTIDTILIWAFMRSLYSRILVLCLY